MIYTCNSLIYNRESLQRDCSVRKAKEPLETIVSIARAVVVVAAAAVVVVVVVVVAAVVVVVVDHTAFSCTRDTGSHIGSMRVLHRPVASSKALAFDCIRCRSDLSADFSGQRAT